MIARWKPPIPKRYPWRKRAVTVCIACIAQGLWRDGKEYPVIIGAADRMITAGDFIEYEPPVPKIHRITPFIVALLADDIATHAAILNRVKPYFAKELLTNPRFFSVEEVANLYSKTLVDHNSQLIERTVLEPFGLSWETFRRQYPEQPEQFPKWYEDRIIKVFGQEGLPTTQTIIAGVDETGAHIYEIDKDGQLTCHNLAGYAVIGIGNVHATSQFMFEGHSPLKPFEETLFLSYVAKRRAEVAPGVGRYTDLIAICLKEGYIKLEEEEVALKKVYDSILKKTEKEKNKLKILIPKIIDEVQEKRRIKWEKEWEENMKKFAQSKHTLADAKKYLRIKANFNVTMAKPENK